MLTGTHEQMMEIANDGKLDSWIDANLKWLKETFGDDFEVIPVPTGESGSGIWVSGDDRMGY